MKKELAQLVRPNIWQLTPYSSARDEYAGKEAHVFLDANESPYNVPYNRYPDPLQWEVKQKIATIRSVAAHQIFLGNGSDEAIDLIFRIFCIPSADNVVSISPTYGMYEVCANTNDVVYRSVNLAEDFTFCADKLLKAVDKHTKVIFLCSPNNPTGNLLPRAEIVKILDNFEGIVVVDEAYAEFSPESSLIELLPLYPRLVVLSTFSKAWGSAGVRLGMAFADTAIIDLMNKVKYPYNINQLTQNYALELLNKSSEVQTWVKATLNERTRLIAAIQELPSCQYVYPTDANFFLVRVNDANQIYNYLVDKGIIVRNRHRISLCDNCLRITIGSPTENDELLTALRNYTTL